MVRWDAWGGGAYQERMCRELRRRFLLLLLLNRCHQPQMHLFPDIMQTSEEARGEEDWEGPYLTTQALWNRLPPKDNLMTLILFTKLMCVIGMLMKRGEIF